MMSAGWSIASAEPPVLSGARVLNGEVERPSPGVSGSMLSTYQTRSSAIEIVTVIGSEVAPPGSVST